MKFDKNFIIIFIVLLFISLYNNKLYTQPQDYETNTITGKTFVFSIPPLLTNVDNKAEVVITMISQLESKVKITARYGFLKILDLKPFEKGTVVMPAYTAFPYQKSGKDKPIKEAIYDAAIRIEATEPIQVTASVKNECGGEGFAVLPIENLGAKYLISSFNDASHFYNDMVSLPSIVTITANYNNTHISFKLGGNNDTKTAGGLSSKEEMSVVLSQGEVWVISSMGENADLTGSKIEASKPISVVTANQCANVPINNKPCNYIAEMEIPLNTFGKTFLVPAFPDRKYSPVLRILAAEENTTIKVIGENKNYTIETSGGIVNSGYLEMRINEPNLSKPGIIIADKPISITLYNTGIEEDNYNENISIAEAAPFQMLLIPQEQALNSYFFAVPETDGTKLFDKNIVCLIAETVDNNFPDNFSFGEFSGVSWHWGAPGIIKKGETIVFDNELNGKKYAMSFYDVNTLHTCQIKNENKFSLYLYGQSRGAGAYGTIAGMGLKDLASNDTLKPIPVWNMLCGGNIIGRVDDKPDNEENRSNLILPVFYAQYSYNYDKEFDPIIPGITQSANWKLFVRNPLEDAKAVIKFGDKAGNDTIININYYAPKIVANPNSINLGIVKLNELIIVKDVSVKNLSKSDFFIKDISFKNRCDLFKIINPPEGILESETEVKFDIQFIANERGIFRDTIVIYDSCFNQNIITIEVAVENSEIYAYDVNFGELLINKTKEVECIVENRGTCNLEIYDAILPKNNDFVVHFPFDFSYENPLILQKGEAMTFKIEFTPRENIQYTDSIIFISDAFGIDSITIINGCGVNPGLVAESYEWGMHRIYRDAFPVNPIPVKNGHNGIRLFNKSNFNVKVDTVFIIDTNNNINGFIIDDIILKSLIGKTLLPEEEYIIPVDFLPTELKKYVLTICYVSELGAKSYSVLSGQGVAPNYKIIYENFDTLLINNWLYPQVKKITINNLNKSTIEEYNWDYKDTLTIYGLKSTDSSVGFNDYSNKGFRVDIAQDIFPIKLPPGTIFEFDCYFVPTKIGENIAHLQVISDAIEDKEIDIKGYGTGKKILCQSSKLVLCKGEVGSINCTIKNNGASNVILNNFYISNYNSIFFIKNEIKDIELKPNEAKIIEVDVIPNSLGEYNSYLKFNVNGNGYNFIDSVALSASSELSILFVEVEFSNDLVKIGEDLWYKVILPETYVVKDISKFLIDSIVIKLHYNSDMLLPQLYNIQLGEHLAGKFYIESSTFDFHNNDIVIYIKSITGEVLANYGMLFSIPFTTLFPLDYDNIVNITNNIYTNAACVTFVPTSNSIELEEGCAYNLRRLKLSKTDYSFNITNSKPIIDNYIDINFSIGLDKAGETSIELYSMTGELINSFVNDFLECGEYNLKINTNNLAKGMYYFIFKSGHFRTQTKLLLL